MDRFSLALLCTGDETLADVLADVRASKLTISGEPIGHDLPIIAAGGVPFLRKTLRADIRAAKLAQHFANRGLDRTYMQALAEKNRQVVWFTWRAYRAAMREEHEKRRRAAA